MRTEKATKTITQSGDSLVINVTKEVKRLGLDRGDDVDITLSPAIDGLDFVGSMIINAIEGLDLKTNDDGDVMATRGDVELIFMSVATCAPSGLVVALDPTRPDYDYIGIFDKDNHPLMEYVFKIIEDHD